MNKRTAVVSGVIIFGIIALLVLVSNGSKNDDQIIGDGGAIDVSRTVGDGPQTEYEQSEIVAESEANRIDEQAVAAQKAEHLQAMFSGSVVLDETMEPLEGVRVEAYYFPDNIFNNAETPQIPLEVTTTDSNGNFSFKTLSYDGTGTLAYRAEEPGLASLIKVFPKGDGLTNRVLTTFLMSEAGTIDGVVVDQEDLPISGAHVGNIILEDSVGGKMTATAGTYGSSWAKSNSDGTFRLEGMPLPHRDAERKRDAREFKIPGFAPGYGKGLSQAVAAGGSEARIVLQRSDGSLFGKVLTFDRRPVDAAQLELVPEQELREENRPDRLFATTDSDGNFVFPNLIAGRYAISATKTIPEALGFDPSANEKVILVKGVDKQVTLMFPEPVELSGTVIDEEASPVEGFIFYSDIEERNRREEAAKVMTTEDGEFAFTFYVPELAGGQPFAPRVPIGLPDPYRPHSELLSDDYRMTLQEVIFKELRPGNRLTNLEINLIKGAVISGRVVEPDGLRPAGDTSVFYRGSTNYGVVMTDAAGYFSLVANPGEMVNIESSTADGIATVRATAPSEEVVLQLEEYAVISGGVYTAGGDGLEGYEIRTVRKEGSGKVKDAIRFEELALTGADGTYRMEKVAPGFVPLRLLLSSNTGFVEPDIKDVSVAPGEELTEVDFILGEGDYIEGYVYNEEGKPLESVSLLTSNSRLSGQTDETGYFRITGIPRESTLAFLSATLEGYQEETRNNVSIYDGEQFFTLKKLRKVVVQAVSESGEPVVNYRVRLYGDREGPVGTTEEMLREKIVTDSGGKTELIDLRRGAYRVEAAQLDSNGNEGAIKGASDFTLRTETDGQETVLVTLSGGLYFRGLVMDSERDAPASGASVLLENVPVGAELQGATLEGPPYRQNARFSAFSGGEFRIGPLAPGQYTLMAESTSGASPSQSFALTADSDPITLILEPSPTVRGEILDEDGQPMRSATLFFARGDAPPEGEPLTVRGGSYEKKLNGSGEWTIIVNQDGTPNNQQRRVVFRAGEEQQVDFDFSDKITLTGTLMVNGAPAGSSSVALRGSDGNEAYARLAGGNGTYTAEVTAGSYQPYYTAMNLMIPFGSPMTIPEGESTVERDILLETSRMDLVVDYSGTEFPRGTFNLMARVNDQTITVGRSIALDRPSVRFSEIPLGDYQVVVTLSDGSTGSSSWTTISRNGQNALVVLLSKVQESANGQ